MGRMNFWGVEQFTSRGSHLIAPRPRLRALVFDYSGPREDD
jgi:hypothetical protein